METASLSLLAAVLTVVIPGGALALMAVRARCRVAPALQRGLLSGYLAIWVGVVAWLFGVAVIVAIVAASVVFAAMYALTGRRSAAG
jgi:uncharacterized membrane protein YcfT